MCGIVGYAGSQDASKVLLNSLERLEYRGYDSAGVAVLTGSKVSVFKQTGRIENLRQHLQQQKILGSTGIAHTRWATHGEPNQINAHPHVSADQSTAVVHNGIIENYLELQHWLCEQGIQCTTETDTEVIAHLFSWYWNGDGVATLAKVAQRLQGSFAIALVHQEDQEHLYCTRKDSPLVVGIGDGEMYIASDITALLSYTDQFYYMEDYHIAKLDKYGVEFFDQQMQKIALAPTKTDVDIQSAEKEGFDHFMLKEMMEQPDVVKKTIRARISEQRDAVFFEQLHLTELIDHIDSIFITACGTAYHAGMIAKYLFEHLANIPVEVEFASEFRYRKPLVSERTLVVVISQSGETADTLAALREAKRSHARVLAIVNTLGSSIAREADDVIYTWAGPEIAVASTKAYIAQLSVIHLLAVHLASARKTMSRAAVQDYLTELEKIPEKIHSILDQRQAIQQLAKEFAHAGDIFFIGRGFDYHIALEGSLKLKEISYIHSEAYAAGELKHGTIALIEQGTFVVALCTQSELVEKMISNIREVKARGARVLAIGCERTTSIAQAADMTLLLPNTPDALVPILAVVPLQLFAYYCAVERGCDVDKPRNLAKSVTVE
jgi:glucosamine--fructose-6-phosphate aminotransferase (isomerizing)